MDRVSLEQLLRQGLSLAEIGRRFGLHESTVGYWVEKHGLEAVHADRHAAKGALSRAMLQPLVARGLSIAQIAEAVHRSKPTVRHWLRRPGLRTARQAGQMDANSTSRAKRAGLATVMRVCRNHGMTEFWLEGRGYYRCKRCRWEAVVRRRPKIKRILVNEAGGRCVLCGYDRCIAAMHFHHLDPSEKAFHLSEQGVTRSLSLARQEAAKCVLLCSNCHAEVETGQATLPSQMDRRNVA